MKTIFVLNPQAGGGKAGPSLLEVLNRYQNELVEIWVTTSAGDARKRTEAWCRLNRETAVLFAVMGGDGTMNEVFDGASIHSQAYFTSIPAGSGNDFARYFSWVPLSETGIKRIIEWDETSTSHESIAFQANENGYAVSNLGAGFDAEVAWLANRSKLKKQLNRLSLGKLVYVVFLIRCLFTFKPFTLIAELDGQPVSFEKVWFVTISNQPYFGGGMRIAPNADSMDEKLDVTVVHGLSVIKFLTVFLSVFKGAHIRFKEVHTAKVKKIELTLSHHVRLHADGEDKGKIGPDAKLFAQVAAKTLKIADFRDGS
ncbi:diacylglycerol kinase family protein [Jeotgalibacillus sp. R-1-5s-1]|uniref:diacylglycerol/lipid kinase family protein n=1 Tax=Jeotgalibacillus sp. R-1-5s-1 TaxID=2555897 RepID=UPI0010693E69|nr:YegS/Rv2252/BmrU family lipid kinase [Jeotgalibacillus sp. R-1-5s-1]TFD98178.1 YegS/Rv2252/BmrU family lipid kinase [Jeotgalibacillus sp. R-1-5s-1]